MEQNTQREKLIDLIVNAKKACPETESFTEFLAGFLIGYGVIVPNDTYDLARLRDLVQADRDGRCFISDVKLGDEVFCIPKYNGKALNGIQKGHVQAISFTKAGKRVRLREYHEYNKDFMLGKTAFTTLEAAEKALKGES